jgi:RraA family protein
MRVNGRRASRSYAGGAGSHEDRGILAALDAAVVVSPMDGRAYATAAHSLDRTRHACQPDGDPMSQTLRILDMPKRVAPRVIAEFAQMVTAHLSDSMDRLYAAGPLLRPMHQGGVLAGSAFTVKTAPGDNLLVHKAVDMAQPGDVIVVDAGGFADYAVIGDLMATRARQRGLAGLVIWGAIRDSAEIRAQTFPVYARAVTHRGPYKNGPGEINVPIVMGGMPVHPGDIVVGDADGVVAVPQSMAERVLASARAIRDKETVAMEQIRAGTVDRSWVDQALKDKGYVLPA